MMNRLAVLLVLTHALALGPMCQGQTSRPTYRKLTLPGGKRFPASQSTLLYMRDKADKRANVKMRAHAWELFAGLTRGKNPIWNSWYTKCNLGLMECSDAPGDKDSSNRLLGSFEVPVQFLQQFVEKAQFRGNVSSLTQPDSVQQSNSELIQALEKFLTIQREHPQFASVLFNEEAKTHIIKDCLHPPEVTIGHSIVAPCTPKLYTPAKIEEFESGSVVLKTTWARVPKEGGSINTYNPCVWKTIKDEHCSVTPVPVMVNTKKTACTQGDYEYGVPISCFYSIQLTQNDADWANQHINEKDGLVSIGFFFLPKAGDYLVLTGVHVTTKETPDWVWATFWWSTDPAKDPKAAGRPASIRREWRNFVMDTTLSATTPTEEDGGPKICFNPYLELNLPHDGDISNCLQCHSKAAYASPSAKVDAANGYDEGILARDGQSLSINPGHQYPDACYFNNRVTTDFLWTVAGALDPKSQELKNAFKKAIALLLDKQLLKPSENPPAIPKQ
jgi:hypothetical protein